MKIGEHNYIQQLQLQNEDALVYVIDTYGGLLKAVIRKTLYLIPGEREECLNDVLLSIWDHIDSFDESRNTFKNWAAAIAKYKAIDYLRKYHKKIQYAEIEEVVIPKEDLELKRLIDGTVSEEMEKLLSCLNEKDRELFWKLYVEEKSMDELSLETGMEKTVIYNRLSRGKQRMKKQHLKEREA